MTSVFLDIFVQLFSHFLFFYALLVIFSIYWDIVFVNYYGTVWSRGTAFNFFMHVNILKKLQ